MTVLRDGLQRLASRTEERLDVLFDRYTKGEIGSEAFVALAAVALARARAQGVALADLALSAEASRALGGAPDPLGLAPPVGDTERLTQSVATVLAAEVDVPDAGALRDSQRLRLGRLARDAAAESVTWASREGMTARRLRGWVRVTDPNPCPVCIRLADDVARSPSVVMKRHTGCMCVPGFVF